MAPPRKILKEQLEVLLDFLEQNKDVSGVIPLTSVGLHNTKTKWASVARKLNAVESGAKKSPKGWKKYWFEWRHKCRKKATYMTTNSNLSFTDLELRALNICNKTEDEPSSHKLQIFLAEDSNSNQQFKIDTEQNLEDKQFTRKRKLRENSSESVTPPPEWAVELEDRRIAAEERIAKALETIASTMQAQEHRRSLVEQRIVETLATIAGNLQGLNCSFNQKNPLQQINNDQTEASMKDVIFL